MAKLQFAMQKYERNTQGKGAYWLNRTRQNINAYCEGIADFLGISAAQCQQSGPGRDYQAAIQAASPAQYDQGVAGKAQKWARNLLAKFSG